MKFNRHFKNYFIAPREQIVFALFSFLGVVLGLGLHTFLILRKILEISTSAVEDGSQGELAYYVYASFLMTVLIVGIFIFLLSILFTHKVFGSLAAIEKHFSDLLDGKNRGPITIRKNDQTKSLVDVLNKYIEKNK